MAERVSVSQFSAKAPLISFFLVDFAIYTATVAVTLCKCAGNLISFDRSLRITSVIQNTPVHAVQ